MDTLPFVRAMREIDTLSKAGDFSAASSLLAELAAGDLTDKQRDLVSMKQGLLTRQSARVTGSPLPAAIATTPKPASITEANLAPVAVAMPAPVAPVEPAPPNEPLPEPVAKVEEPVPSALAPQPIEEIPAAMAEPGVQEPVAASVPPESVTISEATEADHSDSTEADESPSAAIPAPEPSSTDASDDLDDLKLPADVESAAIAISARVAAAEAEEKADEGEKIRVAGDSLVIPAGADAYSTVALHTVDVDAATKAKEEADAARKALDEALESAETVRAAAAPEPSISLKDAIAEATKGSAPAPKNVDAASKDSSKDAAGGAASGSKGSSSDPLFDLASKRVDAAPAVSNPGDPGYVDENYREFKRRLITRAGLLIAASIIVVLGGVWLWQSMAHAPQTLDLTGDAPFKGAVLGNPFKVTVGVIEKQLDEKVANESKFNRHALLVNKSPDGNSLTGMTFDIIGPGSKEWRIVVDNGEPISSRASAEDFEKRLTPKQEWTREPGRKKEEFTFTRRKGDVRQSLAFRSVSGKVQLAKIELVLEPLP